MVASSEESRHPMAIDASSLPATTSSALRHSPRTSRFDDEGIWDLPLTPEDAIPQQPSGKLQSILDKLLKDDNATVEDEKGRKTGKKKAAPRAKKLEATDGETNVERVRKTAAKGEENPKVPRKSRAKKTLADDGLGESPFLSSAKRTKPVSASATKKTTLTKPAAATKAEPIVINSSPAHPELQAQEVLARRTDWTPVRNTKTADEVLLLSDCSNTSGPKRKASEFEGLISSLTFDKARMTRESTKALEKVEAPTTKRRCSDDGFEKKHSTKVKPGPKPKKAPKPKAEPKPRKSKAKKTTVYEFALEKMRREQGLPSLDDPADNYGSILDYFGGDDIMNKPNDAPQLTPNTMIKEATFGTFSQLARGEGQEYGKQRREWTREELEANRYTKGSLLAAAADAPNGEMWDEDMDKFYFKRKLTQELIAEESPEQPIEDTPAKETTDARLEESLLRSREKATKHRLEHSPVALWEEHLGLSKQELLSPPTGETPEIRMEEAPQIMEDDAVPGVQAPASTKEEEKDTHPGHSPMDISEEPRKSRVIEIPDSAESNGTLSDSIEDGYDGAILSYSPTSYQIPEFSRPKPEIIDLSESPIKNLEIADSISDVDSMDYGIDDSLGISTERVEREGKISTQTTPKPLAAVKKRRSKFSFSDSESDEPLLSQTGRRSKKATPSPTATEVSEPEAPILEPKRRTKRKTPSPATTVSEPEEPAPKPKAKRQTKKKTTSEPESVDPSKPNFNALTTTELTLKVKRMGLKPIKTRKGMVEMLDRCWALQHPAPKVAPTTQVPSSQPAISTSPQPTKKSKSKTIIPPLPATDELPLHEAIHLAITTSEKLKGQAYHLKILTYEPLLLEELTDWLNDEGLRDVGYVDYAVSAKVRDWCDEKGVCLFSSGGWATSRETRGRGRSRSVEPMSSVKNSARSKATKGKTGATGTGRGRKKKVVEDSESEREYLDVQ